mmetsp:Transcript_14789/g.23501  ORF Transcript_14789/g.23501 Transcript_14789/m.23501 type:complete len:89 (+) Transcript_14789:31-297(+)|eukprot:CAMPEP_0179440650 /NCGR_PEP_ID=MMETSP0799-20121207/24249_1 /TAXON_ID=46947 /ORGANISM="Geminigera cryophila, Strain CCMP2564" /LENGTH=88 /DNA_ID=CAMNT_0021224211 /DNA_START=805 /DNA_END=1071 /DNA_ORIENTATION=-
MRDNVSQAEELRKSKEKDAQILELQEQVQQMQEQQHSLQKKWIKGLGEFEKKQTEKQKMFQKELEQERPLFLQSQQQAIDAPAEVKRS